MEQRNDELMHYGVPGMRWGVKRAKKAYAKAYERGDKEKMAKLDSKMKSNSVKASRQITKLQKKLPKLQKDVDYSVRKLDAKAASLAIDAAKMRSKAYGRLQTQNMAQKRMLEANKLQAKSDALKARSEEAKAKLEANKTAQELFKKGISEMNKLQVDKGKTLLKYASNIDKAKSDYKSGKIDRREKKDIIRENKVNRKTYLNSI